MTKYESTQNPMALLFLKDYQREKIMREYITQKLIKVGTRISKSRGWQHLKKNHPKKHAFIKSRITLKDFSGLPLTLLFIAMAINLLLLNRFTEDVINDKSFINMDSIISKKLFAIRTLGMAKFFYYFTMFGQVEVITAVAIAAIIISIWKKKLHFIVPIFISVLGCSISMFFGKGIFKIQRPNELSYYHIDNYSFPSGHSAIAIAFYGLLFYFFIRHNYSFQIRMILFLIAAIFIAMIGFSRLYLCEHFLSDVIGGFILGALWLLVSISTLEWEEYKIMKRKPVAYL